jgi:hypothetical protein
MIKPGYKYICFQKSKLWSELGKDNRFVDTGEEIEIIDTDTSPHSGVQFITFIRLNDDIPIEDRISMITFDEFVKDFKLNPGLHLTK